jgi:hypothetical protein
VIAKRADGRSVRLYSDDSPKGGLTGNIEAMCLYSGQSAGLVHSVEPTGRIVENIMSEAETILGRGVER